MKKIPLSLTPALFRQAAKAGLAVAGMTLLFLLLGRSLLGEAVIALLYLLPVGWSASRWGQGPGMCAAVMAALLFDFFFIPPFYTFTIGRLEGWLVLAIFLAVAILGVGQFQASLARAQTSEREAIFMYELSAALASQRTQTAVAHTLAQQFQQMYQAALVRVVLQPGAAPTPAVSVSEPSDDGRQTLPDHLLPIWNAWGLVGEIQLWRGYGALPPTNSRLLQNFVSQAGQALERTRLTEAEERLKVRRAE